MSVLRFSLGRLLGVIALVGLGLGSLLGATPLWASAVFTATLLLLLLGLAGTLTTRGRQQAFWIGFSLFGWGYLWLAHWPTNDQFIPGNILPAWRIQTQDGTLFTTRVLEYAYITVLPSIRHRPNASQTSPEAGSGPPRYYFGGGYGAYDAAPSPDAGVDSSYPYMHDFMRVGHCLCALIFAVGGGAATRRLFSCGTGGKGRASNGANAI